MTFADFLFELGEVIMIALTFSVVFVGSLLIIMFGVKFFERD